MVYSKDTLPGRLQPLKSLSAGPPWSPRGVLWWRLGRVLRGFSLRRARLTLFFCAARASKLHFGRARRGSGSLLGGLGTYFSIVFRAGARSREQRPDPMKTTVFTV